MKKSHKQRQAQGKAKEARRRNRAARATREEARKKEKSTLHRAERRRQVLSQVPRPPASVTGHDVALRLGFDWQRAREYLRELESEGSIARPYYSTSRFPTEWDQWNRITPL